MSLICPYRVIFRPLIKGGIGLEASEKYESRTMDKVLKHIGWICNRFGVDIT